MHKNKKRGNNNNKKRTEKKFTLRLSYVLRSRTSSLNSTPANSDQFPSPDPYSAPDQPPI